MLYQLSYLGPLAACHGDLKHQLVEDTLRGERAQRRAAWLVSGVGAQPSRALVGGEGLEPPTPSV